MRAAHTGLLCSLYLDLRGKTFWQWTRSSPSLSSSPRTYFYTHEDSSTRFQQVCNEIWTAVWFSCRKPSRDAVGESMMGWMVQMGHWLQPDECVCLRVCEDERKGGECLVDVWTCSRRSSRFPRLRLTGDALVLVCHFIVHTPVSVRSLHFILPTFRSDKSRAFECLHLRRTFFIPAPLCKETNLLSAFFPASVFEVTTLSPSRPSVLVSPPWSDCLSLSVNDESTAAEMYTWFLFFISV